jgi:hypothetical protein
MSRTTGMVVVADPLGIITREITTVVENKTKLADHHLIAAVVIMAQKLMMIQLLVQHSTPCHSNLPSFVGYMPMDSKSHRLFNNAQSNRL